MDAIIVTPEGLPELLAGLDTFAKEIATLEPAAPFLAEAWYARIVRWIGSGGKGTFPGLADSTRKQKEKRGQGGNPILVADGTMARAATSSNAPDSIFEVRPDQITLGIGGRSGEIAAFHQYGTDNMAARPLYADSEVQEFGRADALPILARLYTGAAEESGFSVV
jgi:hypothetical protein